MSLHNILIATGIVAAVGLIIAIVLSIAEKAFHVDVDEKRGCRSRMPCRQQLRRLRLCGVRRTCKGNSSGRSSRKRLPLRRQKRRGGNRKNYGG